jgi:hypothetical protein
VMVAIPPIAEPMPIPRRNRIDSLPFSSPALAAMPRTTGIINATAAVFDIHIERTAATSMNEKSILPTSPPNRATME